ncbi:T9SS type A sorting domain-containing protein [Microvirga sp. STS02]|uniref:T9SS type A sorting domain-containing protein n=1 Tax=Hymenobacter negativus TaxID=2795026 RepID=UPI0018DB6678|nr:MULTISPECIES: T9SS type A sorting domain-containing protein [Bacteria]MBH8570878.1 T9SS type A sorting domain-containing protein [Hymenobacter negativus]MBR7210615.1 T9SS type A sorting domain-containing protein [Microvirga sp. STS02]
MFSFLPQKTALRFLGLAATALGLNTTAQAQTRVLFVGNSFTHGQYTPVLYYNSGAVTDLNYNLPAGNPRAHDSGMLAAFGGIPGIFKKFTVQAGLNYDVQLEAVSGKSLEFHHTNALSLIAQPGWDKVVLQEQSTRPVPSTRGGNLALFYDYSTRLEQAIHAANPAAQVYLYGTWARPDYTYPAGSRYVGLPLDSMAQDLHRAFYQAFATNGHFAAVAPVGDAWMRAITTGVATRNPYTPDPAKINLWNVDYVHPSITGSYLSALVLFYQLTNVDPRTLGASEQAAAALGIAPATAVTLQQLAYQQVTSPTTSMAFTPGNVAVVRVGDGSATLTTAATPEFVDEYTLGGALVRSIAMPTADNGTVRAFTNSGTATSDNITRSVDGRYLLLTGYNAAPGTAGIVTSTNSGTTNNRLVARIGADGSVDTNTRINDAFSGTNVRTAVSTDGSAFYVSGGNSGIRYVPFGNAGATTALSTGTVTNFRILGIAGGNLYATSATGSNYGVNQIGTGLPTAAGAAVTLLPGFPTASASPYGFYFADLSTTVPGLDVVYVTDDAATGGIQKWSLAGGIWTLNGTIGGSTTALLRGLTGQRIGTAVQLIASGGGGLYTVTDQAGYNAAPSITALPAPFVPLPANTSFRGVALAPVATALAAAKSAAAPEVSVFPNPATDQLTVQLGGLARPVGPVRATLLNLLGQLVAEQKGMGNTFTFGLADVANGVYLLRLQTAAGVSSRRVEVRR